MLRKIFNKKWSNILLLHSKMQHLTSPHHLTAPQHLTVTQLAVCKAVRNLAVLSENRHQMSSSGLAGLHSPNPAIPKPHTAILTRLAFETAHLISFSIHTNSFPLSGTPIHTFLNAVWIFKRILDAMARSDRPELLEQVCMCICTCLTVCKSVRATWCCKTEKEKLTNIPLLHLIAHRR
jgi:hypothetical protein